MLLLLSSCKGKSQFVVDAKYTPYYNFSIALGETKYFSIVDIKTDEDIFTEMRNHNEEGDSTTLTNKIKLVGENIDCFKVSPSCQFDFHKNGGISVFCKDFSQQNTIGKVFATNSYTGQIIAIKDCDKSLISMD